MGGLSGIWLSLVYIFATPFFWMWPPVVRRMRIVTAVDMFRMRFGRFFEWLNLVLVVVKEPFSIGAGILAAALMVVVMAGKDASGADVISMNTAVAMIAIPTVIYTLLGGIHAVAATDLFQGLLITILSFIGLPFVIWRVGSAAEIGARVNASPMGADAWTLVSAQGFSMPMLVWYIIGVLCSAPLVYGMGSGAARNEMSARFQIIGNLGKRFCTVGWALTGVFAIAMYGVVTTMPFSGNAAQVAGEQKNFADRIFATVSIDVLPAGLRGVMVAAMLAAVMSTIAGMMLGFGGMMVNNVYKNYFVKSASPKHYLFMVRVFTASPIVLAWLVATSGMKLPELFVIVQQINGLAGIAILAAIVWRKTTAWGAVASMVVAGPLFYLGNRAVESWPGWYRAMVYGVESVYRMVGVDPGVNWSTFSVKDAAPIQLTNPIYILAGIATLIVVSLVTKQHDARAVGEFYARLDTPLGDEDRLREAGYQADTLEDLDRAKIDAEEKDRDVSKRLLLLDFFTWPYLVMTGRAKLSDYWVDLVGVAGSLVFIAGFLYLVMSIASFFR